MVQAAPRMPIVGDVLSGRFRVDSVLGEGGMGVVFGARRLDDDRPVAVKVLAPEASTHPDAIPRFINEARAAMRIQNDHVVKVWEVGTLEVGLPFLVMELLEGSDLYAVVEKRGPLPVAEAADHVVQACDALVIAHEVGIVHRDLKPSNLFLARAPAGGTMIKVLDFGVSKVQNATHLRGALTATGAVLGSPHYMAPEQLKSAKDADARADIWSLGVILYELTSGKPPFDGRSYGDLFLQVISGDYIPLKAARPDVPDALEAIVARCLQKNRDARFANVKELVRALMPLASPDGAAHARRILGEAPIRSTAKNKLAGTALMQERPRALDAVMGSVAPVPSMQHPPASVAYPPPSMQAPAPASVQATPPSPQAPPFSAMPVPPRDPPSYNAAPLTGSRPAFVVPGPPPTRPPVVALIVGALIVGVIGAVLIAVALRSRGKDAPPDKPVPAHESK